MNIDFGLELETLQEILNGFVRQLPNIPAGLLALVAACFAGGLLERVVGRLNRIYGQSPSLGIVMGRLANRGTISTRGSGPQTRLCKER